MKNKYFYFTFIIILGLISCNKDEHGCIDSNATNYNSEANIDNQSCCYNCYYNNNAGTSTFLGEFCGNEVEYIEETGFSEFSQIYTSGIPQFDASGNPDMAWQNYTVSCGYHHE